MTLERIIAGLEVAIIRAQLELSTDHGGTLWEFHRQLTFKKIETQEALKYTKKIEPKAKNWYDAIYIRIYLWATSYQSVKE